MSDETHAGASPATEEGKAVLREAAFADPHEQAGPGARASVLAVEALEAGAAMEADAVAEPVVPGPVEPVLEMSEIQGLVVPGFNKHHQTLLGVRVAPEAALESWRALVRTLADTVATAEETLANRRAYRALRREQRTRYPAAETVPHVVFVGLALSHAGLRKLTPGADAVPGEAFQRGMTARAALLGDPTDPADEGHPSRWEVGAPGAELDMLLVVAGDDRAAVTARADELAAHLGDAGGDVVYREDGDIRPDLPGHEHFGFDDGVSQPGIRGRASEAAGDFVTERYIDPAATPDAWLFGFPGQTLVWPGEILLGYPRSSPDPLIPGLDTPAVPAWTRNGSFLVFRRLRQDVGLFWRTMRDEAARLATLPGFEGMTDDRLAALIVGRWPSGAPVNRVPKADDPALGKDRKANNHFRFDSDTPPVPVVDGYVDPHPRAQADPAGLTCPWAAHIRKINTRDSPSDMGGGEATYNRRVLRLGIPYGRPIHDRYATRDKDPKRDERGLLFLCAQSSIEEQFEFLTARWMGAPSRPKMPGGHDLLVGQKAGVGEGRVRRCTLFGAGAQDGEVKTPKEQWVISTGGGYFFVPSISALREVLGG